MNAIYYLVSCKKTFILKLIILTSCAEINLESPISKKVLEG